MKQGTHRGQKWEAAQGVQGVGRATPQGEQNGERLIGATIASTHHNQAFCWEPPPPPPDPLSRTFFGVGPWSPEITGRGGL